MEQNLEMVGDTTPSEMAHWIQKEVQNSKKQCTIRWLLLLVVAKMKVIQSPGADPGAGPS